MKRFVQVGICGHLCQVAKQTSCDAQSNHANNDIALHSFEYVHTTLSILRVHPQFAPVLRTFVFSIGGLVRDVHAVSMQDPEYSVSL
eukprot:COSAG02_NODE_47_length_45434_cov_101.776221_4_plen_87_part_00